MSNSNGSSTPNSSTLPKNNGAAAASPWAQSVSANTSSAASGSSAAASAAWKKPASEPKFSAGDYVSEKGAVYKVVERCGANSTGMQEYLLKHCGTGTMVYGQECNLIKAGKPERPGCDCGGFSVYKSTEAMYHSTWCKLLGGKA